MKLQKIKGVYYVRIKRGYRDERISTCCGELHEAESSAKRILEMFDREKQTRMLTDKLCEYVLSLARKELTERDVSSLTSALEREAREAAIKTVEAIFPSSSVTAKQLWESYIKSSPEVKSATLSTKKQRFNIFKDWAGTMDMRSLDKPRCLRFLESLKCAPQTWNNYISDLSSVFQSGSVENPWVAELRKASVEHQERMAITIDQAKEILKYCDTHAKDINSGIPLSRWAIFLRTLYYLGQRPSDICHLKGDEIVDGRVDLLPQKTSRTRRKVSYHADPKLIALLNKCQVDESGLYFPEFASLYDRNRGFVEIGFKRMVEKSGVAGDGICLYGFRHRYVTYQLNKGNSAENVASVVGHTSTETTENFYYHGKHDVSLSELPEI